MYECVSYVASPKASVQRYRGETSSFSGAGLQLLTSPSTAPYTLCIVYAQHASEVVTHVFDTVSHPGHECMVVPCAWEATCMLLRIHAREHLMAMSPA